jgi:hypothetical protein
MGLPGTHLQPGLRGPVSERDGCRRSVVGVMERPERAPGRRHPRSRPNRKEPTVESGSTQHQRLEMHRCRRLRAWGPEADCDCAHPVNLGGDGWRRHPPLPHPPPMRTGSPMIRSPKPKIQLCAVPAGLRNQDWSRLPDRSPKVSVQQSGPAAPGVEVSVRTLGCRTSVRSLLMWHPPW